MMAKLRVGWIVAGWAPDVRTITRSVLFHSTTWLSGFVVWAVAGAAVAAASTAAVTPVRIRVFISDLVQVDESVSGHWTHLKRAGDQQLFSSRLGKSAVVVRIGTATKCDLFPAVQYGAG